MGRTKKVGITGRFGARGGATLRKRRAAVEKLVVTLNTCPSCMAKAVKRVSVGVWKCRRCKYTFAGGAYTPTTKLGITARRGRGSVTPSTGEDRKTK